MTRRLHESEKVRSGPVGGARRLDGFSLWGFDRRWPPTAAFAFSCTFAFVLFASGRAGAQNRAQSLSWAESLKGAAALTAGSIATARAHFTTALKHVDSPEVNTAVALTHVAERRFRTALALLDRLAAKQAALGELHYWRARILLMLRKSDKACQAMDLALSLGGDRPVFLIAKALACKQAGRTAEGARALSRAVRRHDDLMDPALYPDPVMGVLDLVLKSLATFPNRRRALATMAHLYYQARHYRKAESLADEMVKRWGQVHEALFLKARCRLAAGAALAALTWAERVLGSRPADAAALTLRAEAYLAAGRSDRARADLERAVRLDPAHAVNLSRVGMLQWDKGNYAAAERMFRYALERNPHLASAQHGMALATDRRRQYRAADAHHRRAIRLSPANPVYRKSYAVFLQRQARGAVARKYLAAARKHLAQARTLDRLVKRFRQAVDRATRYASALSRVRSLARTGKTAEALRVLAAVSGPNAPKAFIRARVDAGLGKNPSVWVRRALAGLSAARLMDTSKRVSIVEIEGSLGPKLPVVLRQYLLWVNPRHFR